jgi:hypothetical protein
MDNVQKHNICIMKRVFSLVSYYSRSPSFTTLCSDVGPPIEPILQLYVAESSFTKSYEEWLL